MQNLKGTIILKDIYISEYHDLLEIINKIDDNVCLRFKIHVSNISELVSRYLKVNCEHLKDIDQYVCVFPDIIDKYGDGNYFFELDCSDEDEDSSDVEFIKEELQRQFGANFNNAVPLNEILKILFMGSSYDIIDDVVTLDIYYKTFNQSWLKNNLSDISC